MLFGADVTRHGCGPRSDPGPSFFAAGLGAAHPETRSPASARSRSGDRRPPEPLHIFESGHAHLAVGYNSDHRQHLSTPRQHRSSAKCWAFGSGSFSSPEPCHNQSAGTRAEPDNSTDVLMRREQFNERGVSTGARVLHPAVGATGWKSIGLTSSGATAISLDSRRWFAPTTLRQSKRPSALWIATPLSFGAAHAL
jgi:hypothetical protein